MIQELYFCVRNGYRLSQILSATTDYAFILHQQSANVNNYLGYIPLDTSQTHLQLVITDKKGGSYENKASSCTTHYKFM